MRGLRRGIGLYINEVSSPSYRREVQRLASKGKLAVVVSDDSLAFGVNMPFRTCVFAGEMGGELTPLMAQQMSGRAGRRGLDTQGQYVMLSVMKVFYNATCCYTIL
jgi:ATP-dependent RNA helicase DDX60